MIDCAGALHGGSVGRRPHPFAAIVSPLLRPEEFAPPGTFVGLRLSGGKTGVFQVRSPEEREAGVPVKVMMSKHRAPLAVADQDPVASRAGLRLSPETTEPSHCVVQRVVVEVARSGADCAPPLAHTCNGLFPCRRKS